ncbi:(deoxy)nucleoside triphosphate pyrophosphohydrolase [Planctomonas sp. JC2975]|uniref:(deoxy)nucleoside triphosphate pyrophosphohydrolase n=1 Tax=Planctomonas sp. JC2975 TaxID=2729626 RepID=UPI001475023C|nr:(deoxy)nucleoside triphosphate pyrophosphohydrolase [Planctomonas sp. JC2975]NNC12909.1 (deoxy)nucleoside triphosphate pyrophosphohydrolase [Planctomonas sp. JC2975]
MTADITVVAAIIADGDRILACRRNEDREAGGLWEFPGGKVEPGESAEDALAREIREELGVGIRVGGLLHRCTTPVGGRLVDLSCYWAVLTDAAPASSTDHDDIRWFRRDELRDVDWPEPDRAAVALLADGAGEQ